MEQAFASFTTNQGFINQIEKLLNVEHRKSDTDKNTVDQLIETIVKAKEKTALIDNESNKLICHVIK
jgi:hypothetical protein